MSGYVFEKHAHYCTLKFTSDLAQMQWADMESTAQQVSHAIDNAPGTSVLVDLSHLQTLPEGFIALLVRLWKELDKQHRPFVVVVPQQEILKELRQTGLTSLWTIKESLREGLETIEHAASLASPADTSNMPSISTDPMAFEELRGYCSVQFNPQLMTMSWSDVEATTTRVVQQLQQSSNNSVMVDLAAMDIINSGLVASLVRIWKTMVARKGQFSLVSPNEMVTDVLKTAGLWKLWSVVDEREEAVYELGVSKVAQVEQRERRLLMYVALPCALLAAMALVPMFIKRSEAVGVNSQLAALLLAAAALTTGVLSVLKDKGRRRILSGVAVAVSIAVLSSLWFKGNPISFGQSFPERNFDRDTDETSPASSGKAAPNNVTEPADDDIPSETVADAESSADTDASTDDP